MVVVHAEKGAGTRAAGAGAGAKPHHVHALVHPGEEATAASDVFVANGEEEIKASWTASRERGREVGGRVHIFITDRGKEEEEEEEEGGGRRRRGERGEG